MADKVRTREEGLRRPSVDIVGVSVLQVWGRWERAYVVFYIVKSIWLTQLQQKRTCSRSSAGIPCSRSSRSSSPIVRSVQQSPEPAEACSKRARGRTRRLFPRCIGAKLWGRQFRYFTAGERDRFT